MKVSPVLLTAVVLASGAAFGHAYLVSPPPRGNQAYKTGPCGVRRMAGQPITTLDAGSFLTVTWKETVHHPGHYRIAFSPAGDQGFDQNVLLDRIPNDGGIQTSQSARIRLPAEPCAACTLQLIQVMTETTPAESYFSCANIELRGTARTDGGVDPGGQDAGTGASDAGSGGTFDAGAEDDPQDPGDPGGPTGPSDPHDHGGEDEPGVGCTATGAAGLSAVLLATALALARRRRRR